MPKATPITTPEKTVWKLRLEVGDSVYESEGETVLEAMNNLTKPHKLTGKGILNASYGEFTTRRLYTPRVLKRFFYPMARPFFAKSLSHGL